MAPDDVTEMDALLERQLDEATNTGGKKKTTRKAATTEPPPAAPSAEPEPEPEGAGNSPTGLPNPLGLPLTSCHVPTEMLRRKEELTGYVAAHWKQGQWSKIAPSPTESELYRVYRDLLPKHPRTDGRTNRPVDVRMFVAAIRSIAMGKHTDPQKDVQLSDFVL